RQVPVDAPWTATRAAEWDARTIASWLERCGIRKGVARELFEMSVRGLFTTDLNDVALLDLLFLIRSAGGFSTLMSIEGGYQENLVVGGAGSIARRVADDLGDRVRLNAPVRSITQRGDALLIEASDVVVSARTAVVAVPPALSLEIAFDPPLPQDRAAFASGLIEAAWWKEEWTRGCSMAHFPPGILTRYGRLLREAFGRIHWAGTETATVSHGAIDGAVRSGERAAAEILDRF